MPKAIGSWHLFIQRDSKIIEGCGSLAIFAEACSGGLSACQQAKARCYSLTSTKIVREPRLLKF